MSGLVTPKKIQKLPPTIAERIAAGEVIERPSSVVKELVENSLDAGATSIRVLLEDGGKSLIEVTDNGSGMAPEDLALCIERHATSKLRSLEDLDHILTLGFRGEALPSIAAVSEVSITSRAQGSDTTYELTAGDLADRLKKTPLPEKITFGHFLHSPHGTRIQARGLFSQIPARLKFLKSQGTEVAQVREWLERLSLAYPHVGFQLVSGERTVLQLKPQSEEERVRELLADGEDYPLLSITNEQDGFRDTGLKVKLYWLQGLSTPQNRKLIQVVNSRAIRDKMLQQAMLSPFRQSLLPGQFPALALIMEINPAAIDVNVHPTKAEIRFLDGKKIYQTLDGMVRTLLLKKGAPAITPPQFSPKTSLHSFQERSTPSTPAIPHTAPEERTLHPPTSLLDPDFHHEKPNPQSPPLFTSSAYTSEEQDLHTAADRGLLVSSTPLNEASSSDSTLNPALFSAPTRAEHSALGHPPSPPSFTEHPTQPHEQWELPENGERNPGLQKPEHRGSLPLNLHPFRQERPSHFLQSAKRIGALFQTYLLYELGNELILVDQHAADERIRYERLKKRVIAPKQEFEAIPPLSSQALLIPETLKFSLEDRPQIEARLGVLEKIGFEVEIFGESTLLFRSIPMEWGTKALTIRLKNLLERLIHLDTPEHLIWDEQLFESLASEACHSSVRAGDSLNPLEADALIDQLFECEHPWNCPHGRPTIVRVPEGKVEEWFLRKL